MNVNLATPENNYIGKRTQYYPEYRAQLDKLYHDIDSGKFGDTAKTGQFYLARKAVKDKFPKS